MDQILNKIDEIKENAEWLDLPSGRIKLEILDPLDELAELIEKTYGNS